jgi:hypothetical protein
MNIKATYFVTFKAEYILLFLASTERMNTRASFRYIKLFKNLGGTVGITILYGLDDGRVGVRVPVGLWGPLNILSSAYLGLFSQGLSNLGREADNSPSSSIDMEKTWTYTSTPPYVFMAWLLSR